MGAAGLVAVIVAASLEFHHGDKEWECVTVGTSAACPCFALGSGAAHIHSELRPRARAGRWSGLHHCRESRGQSRSRGGIGREGDQCRGEDPSAP